MTKGSLHEDPAGLSNGHSKPTTSDPNQFRRHAGDLQPMRKLPASSDQRLSTRANHMGESLTLHAKQIVLARKRDGQPVYDFGLGESKGPVMEEVKQAGIDALLREDTKYQHPSGIQALREQIVEWLGFSGVYSDQNVVVTVGAKQALFNTFMTVCNPGDVVLLDNAPWVSYAPLIQCASAVPVPIQPSLGVENHLKLTGADLREAIRLAPTAKLFLVNSPCNPTGQMYTQTELEELLSICIEHKIFFAIDRLYWKVTYDGREFPKLPLTPETTPWIIHIDGLSKNFRSLGGLRVGWTVAPADLSDAMTRLQSHTTSGPATPIQYAALAALQTPYNDEMIRDLEQKRDHLHEHARRIPLLKFFPTDGGFYSYWDVRAAFGLSSPSGRKIRSSKDVADLLLEEYGVVTLAGEAFFQQGFLRLSFHIDNETIVDGMKAAREAFSSLS